jgi:transcriptional regulator with XRE-family HTH domain
VNIRETRKLTGLTQTRVARLARIDRGAYCRFEGGLGDLSPAQRSRILRLLTRELGKRAKRLSRAVEAGTVHAGDPQ